MFGRPAFPRRRPLLRAAVVGGGAYVAGKSAAKRKDAATAEAASQDERISDLEQRNAVPHQASAGSSTLGQLTQLTALHEQGALTDDEFTAAKAKLLGM
jgi:Short C-terminal domain